MSQLETALRPGALDLTLLAPFAGGQMGFAEDVVLILWDAPAPPESPIYIRHCVSQVRKHHERFAVMMFMGEDATVPDRELRAALGAMWRDLNPQAVASTFLVGGLRASIGKTIMNGISRMSGSHDIFRSFAELREAAMWVSKRCSHSPGRIMTTATAFIDEASGHRR